MAKKKAAAKKKTTGKRAPAKAKKTTARAPRLVSAQKRSSVRTSAQKAGAAELDPVTAALQRRRLAMLSR